MINFLRLPTGRQGLIFFVKKFSVPSFFELSYNELLKINPPADGNKTMKKSFTAEEAIVISKKLLIDWTKFDVEQFRMGMDVELEHGSVNPLTNVTNDDPLMTGKIALAHLNELPDYYTRLAKMEQDSENPII